ncbi:unnamed protein product [Rhizophagus irregularis]|nr:unnamed protein product [Rhizophagus irregularis]
MPTMPVSNIEENFELVRNRLVELDRKERTTIPQVSWGRRTDIYVRLVRGEVIAYEMSSPFHASVGATATLSFLTLADKFACQQNYEPSSNHRKMKYGSLESSHQDESNGGNHMPLGFSVVDQLQIGKRLADRHTYNL